MGQDLRNDMVVKTGLFYIGSKNWWHGGKLKMLHSADTVKMVGWMPTTLQVNGYTIHNKS